MDADDTQLIDDSPLRSPSRSSMSGESTGSEGPLHEPTQLLYTQLLDQYEGRMDNAHKTQQLDLDMETQLIDEHNFDDFRKTEGLIIPSEDEASKETQLIHGDDVHSGSSSGKDGEVDSALSPLTAAFHQKTPRWLSDLPHRDRSIEGVAGRTSQASFPYRDRYLGETQILSDDENGEAHDESAKEQRNFANTRAGIGGCPDLHNRDADVPHFLRDFDPNRRDYAGQRMVGSWHEVVGQSDGCNEDDRGWDSAVRGLQVVDSDASTEDEEENHSNSVFNTDLSYPGEAQMSHNVNSRLSTHVSSNFCSQDLNKSPEPENAMDEWEDGNRVDLGVGQIDEGGSNVGLFNRVEKVELRYPSQPVPGNRIGEDLNGRTATAGPTSRTAGSIRAASLRASALQASSCSSSERYRHSTPQGSKSEEVENVEQEAPIEMPSDVLQKAGGSSGDTTAMSRPSEDRGGPLSSASFLSNRNRDTDFPRMENEVRGVGEILDYSGAGARGGSKLDSCRQGEASSVLGVEVFQSGEKNPSRARKLFVGCGKGMDNVTRSSEDKNVEARNQPSLEQVYVGKKKEMEHKENRSSPLEKSLERRSSFGSGLFSTGSDMSYLNLQSPGEDSQARALNMVDKLVWLNAIGLPQELQLEEEKAPARVPLNTKSVLQSRLQVAEAKAGMDDPFGVFDWVDSQNDEAGVFFGSGSTKANAGKGASKLSITGGQPKESGVGSKKGSVLDVAGGRNKRVEKLSDKEKGVKPIPNTDKQKELVSKSMSVVVEGKREQQGVRPGSKSGAPDFRQGPARIESVSDLEGSHQHRVTNKPSGPFDKGVKKLEAMDNTLAADKAGFASTSKGPHQQTSKDQAKQARFKQLSNDADNEHNREVNSFSNKDRLPPGQMQSSFGPKGNHDVRRIAVTEAPEGIDHCILQETNAADQMDKGGCKHNIGEADTSPLLTRNNVFHNTQTKVERGHTTLDRAGCPIPAQGDVVNQLEPSEVKPKETSKWSKISHGASDSSCLPQSLHHQDYLDTAEKEGLPNDIRRYPGSSQHKLDGTKVQLINDYDGLSHSGNLDGRILASVNVPLTVQSGQRDVLAMSPIQDVHTDPDTETSTEETAELQKTNSNAIIGHGAFKEDKIENVAFCSDIVPSRHDVDYERKPTIDEEMHSNPKKGQMATRRGRSQTRYNAKLLDNADGVSNNLLLHSEKGRGRRVTWAGPLEQVPRQSIGLRSRRGLRRQNEGRGDITDSPAESSGQEEEAVDIKEATKSENGARKRCSEALEMTVTRDNDLDKIKRRFNMSDEAVARLLGTDEEEDAELNEARAVKVRSLSHIQPEQDENEVMTPPTVRRISKGLRSARSRSDEGNRRPRSFTSMDQGKLDGDEVIFPFDQNVITGNIDGTTTIDTHPSDNEVITGRRRMRSIADVSFPNLPQTTPGRPPVARGLRRRRGRHFVKSPPPEARADLTDDELTDLPPCAPSSISPVAGQLRGKGGPRSIRKRKEREPEFVPVASEVSMSPSSSKEASPTNFKRRKWAGTTSVLLSHGLNEGTIKQQRKIVLKLGGRVATSASECSHFVADKFVRTGNMLEAMASGKPVVNVQWLETCSAANQFVDDQDFILQDVKKEEEMGFSMISTLTAARQRPLLQVCGSHFTRTLGASYVPKLFVVPVQSQCGQDWGIRVYMTPGTSPGPDSLAKIVNSAGGQVVDGYFGPPPSGEHQSDFCVVISSEEELDDCIPLLEQGAKVYTPELLLSGVTNYHLDFSNDQLFKNFTTRRRRGSSSRRTI